MDGQDFVEVIKVVVRDSAISSTLNALERPAGRRPSLESKENAAWYASLDEEERRRLADVVKAAVDHAVFGFLCVIDGVRAIENDAQKGRLELRYIKGSTTILNSSDVPMLHDLY
jgi:hypothetical protein